MQLHAEGLGRRRRFEPHFTFFGVPLRRRRRLPGGRSRSDSLTGVVIHYASSRRAASSRPRSRSSTSSSTTSSGGRRATSSTCPPTARSATSGWAGPATPRSSRRPPPSTIDVAGFFTKWLGDVAADQYEDGSVPHVVPNVLPARTRPGRGRRGLGGRRGDHPLDACTRPTATRRILEQQYDSMTRWVDYERTRAGDDLIWDGDFQFGDWLAYTAPSRRGAHAIRARRRARTCWPPPSSRTRPTCSRARPACWARRRTPRATRTQLAKIKAAFVREFVSETGRVGDNTQTAYVVALQFDLLPEALRRVGGEAARRGRSGRGSTSPRDSSARRTCATC